MPCRTLGHKSPESDLIWHRGKDKIDTTEKSAEVTSLLVVENEKQTNDSTKMVNYASNYKQPSGSAKVANDSPGVLHLLYF